jgi:hypothetical protein
MTMNNDMGAVRVAQRDFRDIKEYLATLDPDERRQVEEIAAAGAALWPALLHSAGNQHRGWKAQQALEDETTDPLRLRWVGHLRVNTAAQDGHD